MSGFKDENREVYTDLTTVESQRNDLIAEEFPEGPYGSIVDERSLGKSSPWRVDQRPPNRFDYENRELHAGLERGYPGDSGEGNATPDAIMDLDGKEIESSAE
jgi:hypothetical protein